VLSGMVGHELGLSAAQFGAVVRGCTTLDVGSRLHKRGLVPFAKRRKLSPTPVPTLEPDRIATLGCYLVSALSYNTEPDTGNYLSATGYPTLSPLLVRHWLLFW